VDLDLQLELFEHALDEVGDGDLINQVLEISLSDDDEVRVLRYACRRSDGRCPAAGPRRWRPGGSLAELKSLDHSASAGATNDLGRNRRRRAT
jgi:hypothetical protein